LPLSLPISTSHSGHGFFQGVSPRSQAEITLKIRSTSSSFISPRQWKWNDWGRDCGSLSVAVTIN